MVGYLIFNNVYTTIASQKSLEVAGAPVSMGVLAGIIVGLWVSALIWERFHRIKLPTSLAFFSGRRFVPMINALVAAGVFWAWCSG